MYLLCENETGRVSRSPQPTKQPDKLSRLVEVLAARVGGHHDILRLQQTAHDVQHGGLAHAGVGWGGGHIGVNKCQRTSVARHPTPHVAVVCRSSVSGV